MTAPVVHNVKITPKLPRAGQGITLSWLFYDADGHTQVTNEINWYLNDVYYAPFYGQSIIVPVSPVVGDKWRADVRARDSNMEWSAFTSSPEVYIGDDWTVITEMDRGRISQTDTIGGNSEQSRTATRLVTTQTMIGRMVAVDFSATWHTKLQGFGVEYLVRRGMKK